MVQPRAKPKPAPKTRPAMTRVKNTVSMPGRPGAERAQGGAEGRQHAEHGDGLGVDAAVGDLGEDDGQHQHEQRPEHERRHGAVAERVGGDDERPEEGHEPEERGHDDDHRRPQAHPDRHRRPGAPSSGHRQPLRRLTVGRRTSARAPRTWSTVRYSQRGEDLGHLGGEGRGGDDDVGGRAVGHDVAGGHHHHPVGRGGHELDVVGGDDDRPALGGQQVDDADRATAWPGSRARGSARRAARPRARRSAGRRGPARAAGPRRGRGDGCRRGCPGPAGRAAPGRRRPMSRPTGRRTPGRPRPAPRPPCRGRAGRPGSAAPGRPAAGPRSPASDLGSVPATSTRPVWRGPEPWSAHSSDDLPEPLRPMRAVTSPRTRSRSTPRTATTAP